MQGFDYPECSWEDKPSTGYEDKGNGKVRDITYTPDFVGYDAKGKIKWVIECKGFANDRFPNTWKLFKQTLIREGTRSHCTSPRIKVKYYKVSIRY